jgi:hypothetical protein
MARRQFAGHGSRVNPRVLQPRRETLGALPTQDEVYEGDLVVESMRRQNRLAMRYLTSVQAGAYLRLGKTLEQWLGTRPDGSDVVLRWIKVRRDP